MSLKFRGEARKGDKNWGVIRIGDDPKAVRLNEITKSMSIKGGSKEGMLGRSEAKARRKEGEAEAGPTTGQHPGEEEGNRVRMVSLQGGAGPCCWCGPKIQLQT